MANRIFQLACEDSDFCPVHKVTRDEILDFSQSDVVIDFTSREATKSHLAAAIKSKKPLVIGTTGHSEEEKQEIEGAAKLIPILYAPNFSLGVALCLEAVQRFNNALNCHVEISETHHLHKKDAPSGTALRLAEVIKPKEVKIQSIREGEVVGEHVVVFECGHERIELKHTAHSRDAFAHGALRGAKFIVKQSPGLYSLKDLFHVE